MSKVRRDPVRARNATAMLVQAVLQGAPIPMEEPNWLGHSDLAAALDRALIHGCSRDLLRQIRDTEADHRAHLRTVHGLQIEEIEGLYRFSRQQ